MDNFFKFRSLLDKRGDGLCYTVYKSSHDNPAQTYRNMMVFGKASAWLAYDDGMVQHSPDHSFPADQWLDFWYSLAMHLKDNPKDIEVVAYGWHLGISTDEIKFAPTVKYKEPVAPKYTVSYYSLRECKVSSSPSKKHDKRWEEINSSHDGTLLGCIRLMRENMGCDRATWMHNALALRDELTSVHGGYCSDIDLCKAIGLEPKDRDDADWMIDAYRSVAMMVDSFKMQEQAIRFVECVTHNMDNVRRRAEEKAAEQVA